MGTTLNVQCWDTAVSGNPNGTADSGISLPEGMLPGALNDAGRAIMASIARWRKDIGGALEAGGTATALTVTTNQALSLAHIADGLLLLVRTASAATGAATINVDSTGAVSIKKNDGTAIAADDWEEGALLILVYSSAASAFIATNFGSYQPLDATLTAFAGLSIIADRLPYGSGADTFSLATFTAAGRALLDDADASAQLTTLGVSTFAKTILDDTTAADVLTTLGVSSFVQTTLNDASAAAFMTTLGISSFAQSVLDDTTAGAVLTTLGISAFAQTLLDDTTAANFLTTLGVSAFVQTILNDADASTALSTLGVTTFAKTILDDTTAGGVLTTLGVSAFVQTILDDAAATNVLTTLGVTAYAKTLLDDGDAGTARTTLGLASGATTTISSFGATLVDDASAATALTTLGVTAAAQTILDDASVAAIATTLGLGTGNSPQFSAVNVGHASDTTLSRASAGVVAVEGVSLCRVSSTDADSLLDTLGTEVAGALLYHNGTSWVVLAPP